MDIDIGGVFSIDRLVKLILGEDGVKRVFDSYYDDNRDELVICMLHAVELYSLEELKNILSANGHGMKDWEWMKINNEWFLGV